MKDTRVELVEELLKLPGSAALDHIITLAKNGEFHDFKSERFPAPKFALVRMLETAGHHNIAARVKMGEFDERPDADDLAELRRAFGDSAVNMWAVEQ